MDIMDMDAMQNFLVSKSDTVLDWILSDDSRLCLSDTVEIHKSDPSNQAIEHFVVHQPKCIIHISAPSFFELVVSDTIRNDISHTLETDSVVSGIHEWCTVPWSDPSIYLDTMLWLRKNARQQIQLCYKRCVIAEFDRLHFIDVVEHAMRHWASFTHVAHVLRCGVYIIPALDEDIVWFPKPNDEDVDAEEPWWISTEEVPIL